MAATTRADTNLSYFQTSHEGSPEGADFTDTPWNEWLCLVLCRTLGIEATNAEVQLFDGKPVIIVERIDRSWKERVLFRLPQEDLCQALGVSPMRKYQSDGGPGIVDVLGLLNGAIAPYEDRLAFMKMQIVFWLLAAIDGHAKNFSIFLAPGGYRLTPLYDVMSVAPYPEFPVQKTKMAMSIGNKRYYRLNPIQLRHFYQTGQEAGLREQDMDSIFSDLVARMEDAIADAAVFAADAGMPESTSDPILAGVENRAGIIQ